MPTLSASDYTNFIKAQAASYAYRDGLFPNGIQTSAQPYLNKSVLNAQLLASQAASIVTPQNATIVPVNGVMQRVRPYNGKGPVNNPKALSTIHNSTSTTLGPGNFQVAGGNPLTSAKSDGVYAPVAHLARVDTKATGAYATKIAGGTYTNNTNTGVSQG